MAKTAVIKTGGKQYLVKRGDKLKVEKLKGKEDSKFAIKDVLMIFDGDRLVELGKPKCKSDVKVKILEHGKAKKVSVIKYKRKTRYRRNIGHRQPYTQIEIVSIGS